MGVLHTSISLQRQDFVDLILLSDKTDVNLMSSLHGTPLHMACKFGDIKIVQKLLISGADLTLKSQKNGKYAKDITDNDRIVFLIEKYEKWRAAEEESDQSAAEDDDFVIIPSKPSRLKSIFSNFGLMKGNPGSPGLNLINEEDEQELFEDIEKTAGSALDKA